MMFAQMRYSPVWKMSKREAESFLGAAPGVGKTYAMLQAVREQFNEGTSILIGVVETHGRRETLALLDKLPMQARKTVYHRNQRIEEMDLDALLEQKPALAVVDELAHSMRRVAAMKTLAGCARVVGGGH
ncbi:hypothetical protein PCI56_02030 [Plesiomonas shigelloides subsp. oncorhynchi]|nr:hypothetical protein [Plesiomonas shigelloides]